MKETRALYIALILLAMLFGAALSWAILVTYWHRHNVYGHVEYLYRMDVETGDFDKQLRMKIQDELYRKDEVEKQMEKMK